MLRLAVFRGRRPRDCCLEVGWLNDVLVIIHLVVSLSLVGIILLQGPKGEGLGAIGGSARMFHGPRPRESLMTRITAGASILFVITGGILAFWR